MKFALATLFIAGLIWLVTRRRSVVLPDVLYAFFDLDGTIERENTTSLAIREGVNHSFFTASFGEDYEALRKLQRDHETSFEDYDRVMLEMFSRHMRGIARADLDKIAQIVYQNHSGWVYRFTRALIARLKTSHRKIMITGALDQTAGLIARHWGMDAYDASTLEIDDRGCFTGATLHCPAVDKRAAVIRFTGSDDSAVFIGSVAIGDTMSDAPMLELVERPIAFNPVPRLAHLADAKDWPVVRERKGCITVTFRRREKLFDAETQAEKAVEYALTLRRRFWQPRFLD